MVACLYAKLEPCIGGDSVGPDLIAGLWQAFVTEPLNYYCILELE